MKLSSGCKEGHLDFVIGWVNSVPNLPVRQVKFFWEFKLQKNKLWDKTLKIVWKTDCLCTLKMTSLFSSCVFLIPLKEYNAKPHFIETGSHEALRHIVNLLPLFFSPELRIGVLYPWDLSSLEIVLFDFQGIIITYTSFVFNQTASGIMDNHGNSSQECS